MLNASTSCTMSTHMKLIILLRLTLNVKVTIVTISIHVLAGLHREGGALGFLHSSLSPPPELHVGQQCV